MVTSDSLLSWFQDPILRTVTLGTAGIGALGGFIGSFAVIRRQSLQGDAISHAALPGVALAYLLGGRTSTALAIGAAIIGWWAMLIVSGIVRRTRLAFDVALAGTLAVFFGVGLALMSYMQRYTHAAGHGLERYLFGQAATLRSEDVNAIAITGGVTLLIVVLLWRPIKVLCFDPALAEMLGLPVRWLDRLLTALIVIAVVIGLQAVGVVLMSALLVAPAVAARQWTNRLEYLVLIATLLGAASGVVGTLLGHALSAPRAPVPTGPTIVLCATVAVAFSLLCGWLRGRYFREAV